MDVQCCSFVGSLVWAEQKKQMEPKEMGTSRKTQQQEGREAIKNRNRRRS